MCLRKTHASDVDVCGKLEKILICGKKFEVRCGRLNEPLNMEPVWTSFGKKRIWSSKTFVQTDWMSQHVLTETAANHFQSQIPSGHGFYSTEGWMEIIWERPTVAIPFRSANGIRTWNFNIVELKCQQLRQNQTKFSTAMMVPSKFRIFCWNLNCGIAPKLSKILVNLFKSPVCNLLDLGLP